MKKLLLLNLMLLLMSWNINAQPDPVMPAGNGTQIDPYQISSLANLYWLTYSYSEWNKYYIQTADIDASTTSGWWTGGWIPLGEYNFIKVVFSGFYDGNGHTISGLTITNSGASDIGFFGRASGATIQNLGLINVNINAKNSYNTSGALLGYASDNVTINNCYSTGIVKGYWFSGGLVGKMSTSSTVRNSYSTCDVSGYDFTGGLIGLSELNVSIINCFHAVGTVNCEYDAGGLVGYIGQTMISKCHSEGEVTGSNRAGGLVGWSFESGIHNSYSRCSLTNTLTTVACGGLVGLNNTNSFITNSFSTGSVNEGMGGLVGSQNGTTTNSFWDIQTSGATSSAGGTGKTSAEMKTQSTFTSAGWDFTNTWSINAGCNAGYPSLIPAILTLSSGTNQQTICAGTAITPIVYAVDGLVSGVSLSVGPTSGISGIFDQQAKTFTISGTPTGAGTYSFSITTSGILSPCNDATAIGTITVSPVFTPSVSILSSDGDNIICSGTSVTFTASCNNTGGGTISYSWKLNGSVVGSNQNTFTTSTLANGDKVSCEITVTGGTCLTQPTANSNVITTAVNPTFTPSVTIKSNDTDNTICAGTSMTFTATPKDTGGGTISYTWKKNGMTVGLNQNTYVETSLADKDEISCAINVTGGTCLSTITATSGIITITVNPIPEVRITGNNSPICKYENPEFYLVGTPDAEVVYSFDGGTTTWTIPLTGGTGRAIYTEASSEVTLSLISIKIPSTGCIKALTSTSKVTVNNPPTVSISGAHNTCGSTTLTAVTNASDPTYYWATLNEYDWVFEGEGPTLEVTRPEDYYLFVYDGITGCEQQSDPFTVTFIPEPEVRITGNNSPICKYENPEFYLVGTPDAEVVYSFDGGTTTWTVPLTGGTGRAIYTEASSEVTLSLISIKIPSTGCIKALTSTSTVTVNNPPTVSISGAHNACGSTTLTAVTNASSPTYNWATLIDDNWVPLGIGSTLEVNQPGDYYLRVIDETTGCDMLSEAFEVTINPVPEVQIIPEIKEITEGGNVELTASGAESYSWSSVPTGFTSTNSLISVSPVKNTTYTVTGTTYSCSSTASATIYVRETCKNSADQYEPNNSMSDNLFTIPIDLLISANILNAKDPDWYRLDISELAKYTLKLTKSGTVNPAVDLYGSNGRKLKSVSRTEPNSYNLEMGIYYIKVSAGVKSYLCYTLQVVNNGSAVGAIASYDDTKSAEIETITDGICKIWPNPTNNEFKFYNGNEYSIQMKVIDVTGRQIEIMENVGIAETVVFGSNYRPGIYFVNTFDNGVQKVFKVIKQ